MMTMIDMPEITTTTPSPSKEDEIGVGVLSKAIGEEDEEAQVSNLPSELTEQLNTLNQSRGSLKISLLGSPSSLRRSGSLRQLRASLSPRKRRNKKKQSDFHYRSRPVPGVIDGVDTQEQDGSLKKRNNRLTPLINYEVYQWTWFVILCLLAIVDRFKWNVWPRQTYSIGAGSAGSDRLSGFKPG